MQVLFLHLAPCFVVAKHWTHSLLDIYIISIILKNALPHAVTMRCALPFLFFYSLFVITNSKQRVKVIL